MTGIWLESDPAGVHRESKAKMGPAHVRAASTGRDISERKPEQ